MTQLQEPVFKMMKFTDPVIADKVRNGLIQHVNVGADYNTLDAVDAKVPHGLFNPKLSLVAVPGVPEKNVQVLEKLDKQLKQSFHKPMVNSPTQKRQLLSKESNHLLAA